MENTFLISMLQVILYFTLLSFLIIAIKNRDITITFLHLNHEEYQIELYRLI